MGLVLGLVVGRVEVIDAGLQTGLHDGQVLIGQRHIDADDGLVLSEQFHKLGHLVGVHAVSDYLHAMTGLDILGYNVAFTLGARRQHYLAEHIGMLRALVRHYRADSSGTYDQYFHSYLVFNIV